MSSDRIKKRPPPSEAARLAAVAKRRETAAIVKDKTQPEVFIVRREGPCRSFAWEIRRFGSIVMSASEEGFPSLEEATAAGQAALSRLLAEP